jgi:hypothetical protein
MPYDPQGPAVRSGMTVRSMLSFFSSDMVNHLFYTLRCKRCKNIGKEGEEDPE